MREHRRARGRTGALPYALVLPTLAFVALFTLWPTLRVASDSLSVESAFSRAATFAGSRNYELLLADPGFREVILNTLAYVLVTVPVSVVLALLLALELDRPLRAIGLYRLAFFHPTVLPMVSAATIWLFMYAPGYGLVNLFVATLGIASQNWLGDPHLALPALMATGIWKQTGYFMLFYLAGLQGLPREVFDAANLDGASRFQTLRRLTLPLLTGTTLFVTTIAVIDAFQTVDQIYIMTGGGPTNATNMLLFDVYQTLFSFLDVGRASALSIILIVTLLVFSVANFVSLERRASYE